ncbi:MAG: hypothetical protein B7733_14750 [Myxococcales bacterium FL481]|nr:MAG: hypothetical protein B7733_14750 [Myxococcales bacterium FL481]
MRRLASGRGTAVVAAVLVVGASAATEGSALAAHVDVLLAAEGDKIVTGTFAWGTSDISLPEAAFSRGFEYVQDNAAVATNPGFNAVPVPPAPYESLPSDTPVAFSMVPVPGLESDLAYWDGHGEVSFVSPTGHASLSILHALSGEPVHVMGANAETPGFAIGTTAAGGLLHEHHQIVLVGPDSGQLPSEGVYVFAMRFHAGTLESSPPAVFAMQFGLAPDGGTDLNDELATHAAMSIQQSIEDDLAVDPSADDGCNVAGGGFGPSPLALPVVVLVWLSRRRGRRARP